MACRRSSSRGRRRAGRGIPVGEQPSTHILKPTPLHNDGTPLYPGLAETEHFCLRLASVIGEAAPDSVRGVSFTAASTELRRVAGRTVLVVTRYDRAPAAGGAVRRLHQEDGCQVLGIDPGRKYQQSAEGPPSLRAFADALAEHGSDPLLDQRALLQQLTFTVCTANADLHARNLSVLHSGGVRLAPLYDVVTTTAYSNVDRELGLRKLGSRKSGRRAGSRSRGRRDARAFWTT